MSSGFVAGTLVHTDKGLIPIQNLQVGDLVLSKPESGEGEVAYKRMTQTFVRENQPIWGLEIFSVENNELKEEYIFSTDGHPIWELSNSEPIGKWVSISNVEQGNVGIKPQGKIVTINEILPLYATNDNNQAFFPVYYESGYDTGIFINVEEYKAHTIQVHDTLDERETIEEINENPEGEIIDEFYLDTVYNFEVEDYHTYFVGEQGLWVSDSTIQGTSE